MVLGNVEDERCFFKKKFMKSKLKNKLTNHLNLVVRMFVQKQYSMDIYPFGDAIKNWWDRKQRYVEDV
jgi:hypothetical protein